MRLPYTVLRRPSPRHDAAEPGTYRPIEDHAAIGDCRTIALVTRDGTIDWLCLPHFSASSVFGALLDAQRGGEWRLGARETRAYEWRYLPRTNVLETTHRCAGGTLRIRDFMTIAAGDDERALRPQHELVRIAECVEGEVTLESRFAPRPGYGRREPVLRRRGALGWWCTAQGMALALTGELEWRETGRGTLAASRTLRAGESCASVLSYADRDVLSFADPAGVSARLRDTVQWWRRWSDACGLQGPHREAAVRSCLALKLLTYSVTGALVAAATTSLPEGDDGARNWDYRYCWLRDASLVLHAFADVGYVSEGAAFLNWLLNAAPGRRPRVQVLYDLHGESDLPERELPWLSGWRGISPVRVGNGAHAQRQLDVYGEVVITAYDYMREGGELDAAERALLAALGRSVMRDWRLPDQGIWEVRTPPRHNTHSKLMCWAAMDRLAQLAAAGVVSLPADALRAEAERVRADIEANAFRADLGTYVGYYGASQVDASLLLMARYGYLPAGDPRMRATAARIERDLAAPGVDGLLYRYPPGGGYDGVAGAESAFFICSFWLVEYLARAGELERAESMFERLLALGNDLGLYAEEYDIRAREHRGNFPQAFSHVGLINAALAIEAARRGAHGAEPALAPDAMREAPTELERS